WKNCPGDNWDYKEVIKGIGVTVKDSTSLNLNTGTSSSKSNKSTETTSSNVLKRGDKGKEVLKLQQDLIKAGEKLPKYGADGSFGEETEKAVKNIQKKAGI